MSASEYWTKAETLMAEHQYLTAGEIADELTKAGYILANAPLLWLRVVRVGVAASPSASPKGPGHQRLMVMAAWSPRRIGECSAPTSKLLMLKSSRRSLR